MTFDRVTAVDFSDAASVGTASMNESIDSLSRSLTPRAAPLRAFTQIDLIRFSESNS
jgi:hypothetical protein